MLFIKTLKLIFILILLSSALLIANVKSSMCSVISEQTLVKRVNDGLLLKLIDVVSAYENFQNDTAAKRHDFETLDAYNKRIKINENRFENFLRASYTIETGIDQIRLNWENSSLLLTIYFPVEIMRKRGGREPTKTLAIIISDAPDKIREIFTFQDQVALSTTFKFNSQGSIVFEKIIITYRGSVIFYE